MKWKFEEAGGYPGLYIYISIWNFRPDIFKTGNHVVFAHCVLRKPPVVFLCLSHFFNFSCKIFRKQPDFLFGRGAAFVEAGGAWVCAAEIVGARVCGCLELRGFLIFSA